MAYLNFIGDKDLINHIKKTLSTYSNTIKAIDLKAFNSNLIDPIKLTFDSKVYRKSIEQIVVEEISRQRDKTNSNAIGYFHQNIFKYINGCAVPTHGFDVIVSKQDGSKIYVELKNKHNTMNSSSAKSTYIKLLNKATDKNENNAIACLVEIIAKKSQNIVWAFSLDGERVANDKVRRISIDKFYEIITGEKDSFKKLCEVLPVVLDKILGEMEDLAVEEDTVVAELKATNPNLLKAIYLLAFNTYEGFEKF